MCDCCAVDKKGNTWSYQDRLDWPRLYKKYFSTMKTPIDIDNSQGKIINTDIDINNLQMNWSKNQKVYSVPNQNYIQYNCLSEDSYITLNNDKYNLLQFHFHASAENTINKMYYPMEVHFVHGYTDESKIQKLVVIALHLEQTRIPNEVSPLTVNLVENYDKEVEFNLSIYNELPNETFYRWLGSLTIPPFSNNLLFNLWTVNDVKYKFPVGISPNNLYNFNHFFADSRDLITNEYKENREALPLKDNFLAVSVIKKKK